MARLILIFFILLFICGCKEQLLHDLTENDATRMIVKLARGGIEADKERQPDGLWSVIVSRDDRSKALIFLHDQRELRSGKATLNHSSFVSSRDEQRYMLERRLAAELQETLSAIPSVAEARVHLKLTRRDPILNRPIEGEQGSASVMLVVEGEAELSKEALTSLVSGAVSLPKTAVSILITRIEKADQFHNLPIGVETSWQKQYLTNDNLRILAATIIFISLAISFYRIRQNRRRNQYAKAAYQV
jgi:type III secretory pathway lipoprotein EscJ